MILDTIRRWFGGGGAAEDPGDPSCPEAGPGGEATAGGGEMLTCAEALEWMYEFMDGELPDVDAEKVDRHFRMCQACYPHLKLEEGFRARLRTAVGGCGVPAEVRSRVLELLAREDAEGA